MGEPLHVRARAALLVAAALVAAGCAGTGASTAAAKVAAQAQAQARLPATRVVTLEGETRGIDAICAGRPAIVSLWATWCEACFEELAPLNRLHDRTQKDAVIAAVAIGEDAATVRAFAKRHGLRYALLLDPDFALARALGSEKVPTTLVIDRDGNIVFRGGLFDGAALAAFRALLEAEPKLVKQAD